MVTLTSSLRYGPDYYSGRKSSFKLQKILFYLLLFFVANLPMQVMAQCTVTAPTSTQDVYLNSLGNATINKIKIAGIVNVPLICNLKLYRSNPNINPGDSVPFFNLGAFLSLDCSNVGQDTVLWVTSVLPGPIVSGPAQVRFHVIDSIRPTISCPSNFASITSTCTFFVSSSTPPTVNDACGPVSLSYQLTGATATNGFVSGTITNVSFNVGVTTATWVATDANGNTASCQQTFTITESPAIPPTLSNQPANITLYTPSNSCFAVPGNALPNTTASDNCPGVVLEYRLYKNNPAGPGDTLTPWLPGQVNNVAFPYGTTFVHYRARDASGNIRNYLNVINNPINLFRVTVRDTVKPLITCPASITVPNTFGLCNTVIPTGIAPSIYDNCLYKYSYVDTTRNGNGSVIATGSGNGSADGVTLPVGITRFMYTVTDSAGNTARCSFTVTVNDQNAPSVTCPGDMTVNIPAGQCNVTINAGLTPLASSDNCPGAIAYAYFATGATTFSGNGSANGKTFNTGTTYMTYTASDLAGNSAQCTFKVFVLEPTPPTISCLPNAITVNTDANSCLASFGNALNPTYGDNCGGTTLTFQIDSFDIDNDYINTSLILNGYPTAFPPGAYLVYFTVRDSSGNTATCSDTITVRDAQPPVMTCPQNIVLLNPNPGLCGMQVFGLTPNASDNCPTLYLSGQVSGPTGTTNFGPTTNLGVLNGFNFRHGMSTVTYTVRDNFNNSATCSFMVTIRENVKPVINCPNDVTVNITSNVCSQLVTSIPSPDIYDLYCFYQNTKTVYYELSGATTGNGTTTANLVSTYFDPFSGFDVGIYNTNGANGNVFNLGVTTVTYVVIDGSGNSDTCSFRVIVNDAAPPTVSCPTSVTAYAGAACTATVTNSAFVATTNDNCGTGRLKLTYTLSGATTGSGTGLVPTTTFNRGLTTIVYRVTDTVFNNSSTCSLTVNVLDTVKPLLVCPANTTISTSNINCTANVSAATIFSGLSSSDNCTTVSYNWNTTGVNGGLSGTSTTTGTYTMNIGTTTFNVTATDVPGNTRSCSFTVTIKDLVAPNVIYQNQTYNLVANPTSCQADLTWTEPTLAVYPGHPAPDATDACGLAVTINRTYLSGPNPNILNGLLSYNQNANPAMISNTSFNIGTTVIRYTFTDADGNSTFRDITVNVSGSGIPQSPVCKSATVFLNNAGTATVTVADVDNTPTNPPAGCPPDITNRSVSPTTFTCADVNSTRNVVLTFNYSDGSVRTCTAQVTIRDLLVPTLSGVPANTTINCNQTLPTPANVTATDNCGQATVGYVQSFGPAGCNQVVTRTWTAQDGSGNTATGVQTITIIDTQAPTFTGAPTTLSGTCGTQVSLNVANFVTDNGCAGNVTISNNSGKGNGQADASGFYPVGTTTVTFTATDACGNSSTHSVQISIAPNPNFTATTSATQTSGPGQANGSATVSASGGSGNYSYLWSNGGTTSTINGLLAGTYNVTVTDNNGGCTLVRSVTVTDGTNLCANFNGSVSTVPTTGPGQANGSATASATGGSGNYTYTWSTGGTGATINNLIAGTYTCTIVDVTNNCTIVRSGVVVDGNPCINFSCTVSSTPTSGPNQTDGSATASASGGSGNYFYSWSNNKSGANNNGLSAGTYTVTVTDLVTNCTLVRSVTVTDGTPGTVILMAGSASGNQNDMLFVPVKVRNFTSVAGYSFSMNIADTTKVKIVGVDPVTLGGNLPLVNQVNGGTVSIIWSAAAGVTLPNDSTIVRLKVMLVGGPGMSTNLNITGSPTPLDITFSNLTSQTPSTTSGIISINQVVIQNFTISGNFMTPNNQNVGRVNVAMTGSVTGNQNTGTGNTYSFQVPQGSNVTIRPSKNINHKAGLNVADVNLIQSHVIANPRLSTAYKRIAADVNRDNKITTVDGVELSYMIVGLQDTFKTNTSWRFVPKDSVVGFMMSDNYVNLPIPESVSFTNIVSDKLNVNFFGIKIGDVSESNTRPDSLTGIEDRSLKTFTVEETELVKGDLITVPFRAEGFSNMTGLQTTLEFDPTRLEFAGIEPGVLNELSADRMNFTRIRDGLLPMLWTNIQGQTVANDANLFSFRFKVKETGLLSKSLTISSSITESMMVDGDNTEYNLDLRFTQRGAAADRFELLQNRPNPFQGVTVIGFHLPEATTARLTVYDVSGKVVKAFEGDYAKGYNEISLTRNDLGGSGVYYYQLETSKDTARKKLIITE